jgi:hypothetical protein
MKKLTTAFDFGIDYVTQGYGIYLANTTHPTFETDQSDFFRYRSSNYNLTAVHSRNSTTGETT